jgi:hypothetical protein
MRHREAEGYLCPRCPEPTLVMAKGAELREVVEEHLAGHGLLAQSCASPSWRGQLPRRARVLFTLLWARGVRAVRIDDGGRYGWRGMVSIDAEGVRVASDALQPPRAERGED